MRNFIERALNKLPKLDEEQIKSLIRDIASENELLEIVLDSMTDGVVVLNRDHVIILHNKSAERLLPFVSGEIVEKPLWKAVGDPEISGFFKASLESQERIYDEQFTLDSSGGIKILSCSIMPLVRTGEVLGSLVHIENVTEKKSKEARLRRAESLASLTTLAAGVAHEIKNPLGSIGIHIQLIQKELLAKKKRSTSTIHRYLDIINEEIERLDGIVINFLFAVRPMNTNLERRQLNELVKDTIEFVKYELEEANIKVEESLSNRLPKLDLDERYIKQALLNLIKNGITAMPDGGNLKFETQISSEDVQLKISDNGVGIPEENMAKIFEPYFTTREFGSGLGLTVVYKILKEHGGEISLTSKAGEGTAFTMSFPVPSDERNLIAWKETTDAV